MKLLVLTSEPTSAARLRDALPGEISPEDAEVMVVAPALQDSPLRFWARMGALDVGAPLQAAPSA